MDGSRRMCRTTYDDAVVTHSSRCARVVSQVAGQRGGMPGRHTPAIAALVAVLAVAPAAVAGEAPRLELDPSLLRIVEPWRYEEARRFEAGWNRGADVHAAGALVRSPVAGRVRFVGRVAGRVVLTLDATISGAPAVVTMTGVDRVVVARGERVAAGTVVARGRALHVGAYDPARRTRYLPVVARRGTAMGDVGGHAAADRIGDELARRLAEAIVGIPSSTPVADLVAAGHHAPRGEAAEADRSAPPRETSASTHPSADAAPRSVSALRMSGDGAGPSTATPARMLSPAAPTVGDTVDGGSAPAAVHEAGPRHATTPLRASAERRARQVRRGLAALSAAATGDGSSGHRRDPVRAGSSGPHQAGNLRSAAGRAQRPSGGGDLPELPPVTGPIPIAASGVSSPTGRAHPADRTAAAARATEPRTGAGAVDVRRGARLDGMPVAPVGEAGTAAPPWSTVGSPSTGATPGRQDGATVGMADGTAPAGPRDHREAAWGVPALVLLVGIVAAARRRRHGASPIPSCVHQPLPPVLPAAARPPVGGRPDMAPTGHGAWPRVGSGTRMNDLQRRPAAGARSPEHA